MNFQNMTVSTKLTLAFGALVGLVLLVSVLALHALGDANDATVALRCLERLSAPPYQLGFARGYGVAAQRYAAEAAEQLLRGMRAPKIGGRKA